ncbi:hypothetical protein NXX23_17760 [Bacteroides ovatus]|nr:hypothetical protein [Bacteroides ovatus]
MYAAADSISGICIRMWKSSWYDLGTLMLKDYDALCGEKRTYYPVRKMAHKRALLENKRKSDNQKKGGNTYEGK